MIMNTFNPSPGDAEPGRSLKIQDQPYLHSEFYDCQSYKVRGEIGEEVGKAAEGESKATRRKRFSST